MRSHAVYQRWLHALVSSICRNSHAPFDSQIKVQNIGNRSHSCRVQVSTVLNRLSAYIIVVTNFWCLFSQPESFFFFGKDSKFYNKARSWIAKFKTTSPMQSFETSPQFRTPLCLAQPHMRGSVNWLLRTSCLVIKL